MEQTKILRIESRVWLLLTLALKGSNLDNMVNLWIYGVLHGALTYFMTNKK